MKTLYVIYFALMLFWFVNEIYYSLKLKAGKDDKKVKNKVNLTKIWILFTFCFFCPMLIAKFTDFIILKTEGILFLGIGLLVFGIFLRLSVIRFLGKYFTVELAIKNDHKLIKHSFYRLVRHPSYTGVLLGLIGSGIFLNNWVSLIVAFLPMFLMIIDRIKTEENALIQQFGNEYLEYKKSTKKLIPFIY